MVLPPPPIQGVGNSSGFTMMAELRNGSFDYGELQGLTRTIIARANDQSGLTRISTSFRAATPQLRLDIDRVKAATLHVALGDVFQALSGYLGSSYVNQITKFGRVFQVYVQADSRFRATPADIDKLWVRNSDGAMIPLGTIVSLHRTVAPALVSLYNLYPAATIVGQPAPGFSSGQSMTLMEQIANATLPPGTGFDWTAMSYQEKVVGNQIVYVFGLAMLLVYLVLAGQYESWYAPLSVILAVPLALLGPVVVLEAAGAANNLYTQIGLILLIALSAKNAILIVEVARERRAGGAGVIESAVEAAQARFRPILMTSFAFILGVLPLVFATGAGASARRSIGVAVASGMTASTCLAVLFVPSFFVLIQRLEEWRARRKQPQAGLDPGRIGAAMRTMLCLTALVAPVLLPAAALAATALTPPVDWPRTLSETGGQRVEIFQPQIESWQGDRLGGRAAIAVGPAQGAPTFGVAVFSARVEVDKPAGIAHLDALAIEHVDIPTAPAQDASVKTLLQSRMPKAGITTSLDQLLASYAVGQQTTSVASVAVENPVPRIVFAVAPAALVLIDGAPVLHALPGSTMQRVVNTRPLVLKDAGGTWYALAAGHWYRTRDLTEGWAVLASPPAALAAAEKAAAQQQAFDPLPPPPNTPAGAPAPALVASVTPAELVQTKGQPELAPVPGTTLLEIRNADHAAFVDTKDNRTYVLVSGRWFAAADRAGPWSAVAADALPADFAKIPPADPMANALVSVPGTPQAKEAVIASTIPQTATVNRTTPALRVSYVGAPAFKPMPPTALQYATNTATPVIRVSPSAYYAVSNGVWFVAATPNGPWHVATTVPAAIYTIPPSSPLYYVTYVHVYRVTPTAVVVGYTPGYLGVVVAPTGTVVYGTGTITRRSSRERTIIPIPRPMATARLLPGERRRDSRSAMRRATAPRPIGGRTGTAAMSTINMPT